MINKIKELEKYIGNTKMVLAESLMKKYNLKSNIYLKLEKDNYSGSIKDRIVYYIIKDGIEKGLINEDTIIVEATSGNTGISVAAISKYLGIKCIIVMPDSVSKERIEFIKKYDGKVILTSSSLGMSGSIDKLNLLINEYNNVYILDQFNNKLCVDAHYKTTGVEIYNEINNIDIFISGIGTGGTFTGCAKYLKEKNKNALCIGVEPSESKVLKGGKSSTHKIEGIGANFIPSILDRSYIDDIIDVDSETAYLYTNVLYKEEGLMCGISSGAAIYAGIEIGKKYINKNIVIILPDDGNRYLSKGLYKN